MKESPQIENRLLVELKRELPTSSGDDRQQWARQLLEENTSLSEFLCLFLEEEKIATRFAWLISDIAEIDPEMVYAALPDILLMRPEANVIGMERSLSKWWHICGIPEDNEGEAVDLLLAWLGNPQLNVSTWHHCLIALMQVIRRHPGLTPELRLVLEANRENFSPTFRKKVDQALRELPSQT